MIMIMKHFKSSLSSCVVRNHETSGFKTFPACLWSWPKPSRLTVISGLIQAKRPFIHWTVDRIHHLDCKIQESMFANPQGGFKVSRRCFNVCVGNATSGSAVSPRACGDELWEYRVWLQVYLSCGLPFTVKHWRWGEKGKDLKLLLLLFYFLKAGNGVRRVAYVFFCFVLLFFTF